MSELAAPASPTPTVGKLWGSQDPLGAVLNGLERHFGAGPRSATAPQGKLHAYGQIPSYSAEREGFEPSMDGTAHTGFRDRRIQPLCHLSG